MAISNLNCCSDLLEAVINGCVPHIEIYVENEEQRFKRNCEHQNAIHIAIRKNPKMLFYLLPKMKDRINDTEWILTTTPIEMLILSCRADLEAKKNLDLNLNCIKLLIQNGADLDGKITTDGFILRTVMKLDNLDMFKFLVENGVKNKADWTNFSTLFLAYSLKKSIRDKFLEYIFNNLHHFYQKRKRDYICNCQGDTILHWCFKLNDTEDFLKFIPEDLLITLINQVNKVGRTPLFRCVEYINDIPESIRLAKYLLDKGASLDIKDNYKKTVLTIAEEKLECSMIKNSALVDFLRNYQDLPSY